MEFIRQAHFETTSSKLWQMTGICFSCFVLTSHGSPRYDGLIRQNDSFSLLQHVAKRVKLKTPAGELLNTSKSQENQRLLHTHHLPLAGSRYEHISCMATSAACSPFRGDDPSHHRTFRRQLLQLCHRDIRWRQALGFLPCPEVDMFQNVADQ